MIYSYKNGFSKFLKYFPDTSHRKMAETMVASVAEMD